MRWLRDWLTAPQHQQSRLIAAVALLAFLVGYAVPTLVAFLGIGSQPSAYGSELSRLRSDNRRLNRAFTRLQTDTQVDRAAYAQVEKQLAELQEKILDQQEELAFYRGVVGGSGESGLQVKDFALGRVADGRVELSFVIAQISSTQREVAGTAQIRIEGERGGRVVSIDVAPLLSAEARRSLSFQLRYFQNIRVNFAVPADFTPSRVVLRVQPAARGSRASVASFPWAVMDS